MIRQPFCAGGTSFTRRRPRVLVHAARPQWMRSLRLEPRGLCLLSRLRRQRRVILRRQPFGLRRERGLVLARRPQRLSFAVRHQPMALIWDCQCCILRMCPSDARGVP